MNFLQAILTINTKPSLSKSLQPISLFLIRYISLKNISSRQNLRFLTFLSTFLLLILFKPTAAGAVSVQLDGTRTILSGADCGIATYRFGTSTTYNGQAIDLLVEVLSEDNDTTSSCIIYTGNSITVDMVDADVADNFAFMDLKITVVKKGTVTPVEIDRLAVSGFDLDSTTGTGTDDVYFKNPDGTFISPGSNVTATTGSFFGGQYQTKLKGQASGNCNDSPATGGTIDVACRGAAMFVNGANGPNTVSSVTLRVQNDNASATRRFQLSFDFSYINQLITNIQDYGDADTSYGVAGTAASATLSLGTGILPDNETTNQFSASANGDDLDGATNGSKFDDEDAVKLNNQALDNQTLFTNTTSNLNVATFGTGYLSAWLDLNKDGDFLDAGEKVTNDLAINSTTITNSSIPITIPGSATAGNTAMRFRFSAATGVGATGFTSTGEVEDYQIAIARYDYGDAPSSFGDAIHDIPLTPTVYLGSVKPDKELSTQLGADAGAAAAGDDSNGTTPDDEDAFTTLANVSTVGNYNLTVPVTNTSGGAATLHAWIDFNKNGKIESGEYQSAAVNNTTTGANLNWTVPIGTLPGSTHARFRLTTDNALTDNSGTTNVDERSLGTASNGEVEDYPVTIAVPIYDYGDAPDASAGTGTGNYQTTAIDGGAAQVKINTAGQILSLGSNIDTDDGSLQNATALADDNNGTPDDEDGIASFPALTTTANQTYTVPVTVSNNVPLLSAYLVGYIDFNKDGDFLDAGEKSTTVTVPTSTTNPRTVNVTFTTPGGMTIGNTYARFRLGQVQATAESATGASISTDSGEIEDYQIAIAPALDYGDAPDTYGTDKTTNNSSNTSDPVGANHIITSGLFLGATAPDNDANGFVDGVDNNSNATDDDAPLGTGTGNGDDEDNFTLPTLTAGATGYTIPVSNVTATNTTGQAATLHAWIDFNKNGKFDSTEYTSVTVNSGTNGGNPTANLTWSGISVGTTGNTYARFRLTSDVSINSNTPGGAANNGEVEDYQVAIAQPIASDPKLLLVKRITAI
ncbi:MAG: hypothetical protein RLZZ74_3109, partial [Cyanobacteriota bacterium]